MAGVASSDKAQTRSARAIHREKTSLSLTPDAKFKLTTLKAALRREGFSATESSIIEVLLERADAKALMKIMKVG